MKVSFQDEVWPLVDHVTIDGLPVDNAIAASEEENFLILKEKVFYRDGECAGEVGRKFIGVVEIVWKQASVLPLSVLLAAQTAQDANVG